MEFRSNSICSLKNEEWEEISKGLKQKAKLNLTKDLYRAKD